MEWRAPLDEQGQECVECTPGQICKAHISLPISTLRGSKSIFTKDSCERFLKSKRLGASDKRSCEAAGWSQEVYIKWKREVREGRAPASIVKFVEEDVPAASRVLYEASLEAIGRGVEQEDDDKAAKIGLAVLEKLYGDELNPMANTLRHTGADGEAIEFRIVIDGEKKE